LEINQNKILKKILWQLFMADFDPFSARNIFLKIELYRAL
jgi:hypothetical protein